MKCGDNWSVDSNEVVEAFYHQDMCVVKNDEICRKVEVVFLK